MCYISENVRCSQDIKDLQRSQAMTENVRRSQDIKDLQRSQAMMGYVRRSQDIKDLQRSQSMMENVRLSQARPGEAFIFIYLKCLSNSVWHFLAPKLLSIQFHVIAASTS